MHNIHLLRLPQVLNLIKLSRATFYKQVKEGTLPTQIHLGANSVAWLSHEIESVLAARICGYTEAELKELVLTIIAKREIFKEEI
ncbi:helix-turn-helix transcriptional regulator [Photobacterium carnosum]|uniref:helix-turn-helix transcriptional regulator n=1 Tax=Photobacterium carnosum TaxID=2023717 RepID=UPI001E44E41B|nr:AlpA family transcriptional regulator [Photobacterium carnosum]MCD9494567.1 AlpA family phage regulatory protein [Photobacterium carnosum]